MTFPQAAPSDEWRARRSSIRLIRGTAAIERAVSRWQPLDPLLIASPGHTSFAPVLSVPRYTAAAHAAAMRQQRLMLFMSVATSMVFLLLWLIRDDAAAAMPMLGLLALSGFLAIEYVSVTRNLDVLRDRALFSIWIRRAGRLDVLIWSAVMVAAGVTQLVLQHALGGLEPTIMHWGAVYERLEQGEWWRLVTGPFFHSSARHWIANTALLVFMGTAVSWSSRTQTLGVFLLGSTFGAATSLVLASADADAYLGLSAGILAILGWGAGCAVRDPQCYPRRFPVTLASFALVTIVLGWLLNPDAANLAHVAGLMLGAVLGLAIRGDRDPASVTARDDSDPDSPNGVP